MNIVATNKGGGYGNNPWDTIENCAKMSRAHDNGGLVIGVYAAKHIGDCDGRHYEFTDYGKIGRLTDAEEDAEEVVEVAKD